MSNLNFGKEERQLRVLYAAGPGNAAQTFQYWQSDQDDPSQMAVTYSGQFFDTIAALNARGYLLSSRFDPRYEESGNFIIEHRPIPFCYSPSALLYYLGQIWYGLGIITTALRFRADVAIVTEGITLFFLMTVLPWLGVEVVPSIHCVLWQKYSETGLSRIQKIILRLSKRLFSRACLATIVVADEIGDQVREIAGEEVRPILRSFPVYRPERFAQLPDPERSPDRPFHILFAGRVVTNKGVFDLLEVAKQLRERGGRNIIFDVCGKGDALDALREAVAAANLEESFLCHGHCNQDRMRQIQEQSHVLIVPTRTEFIEGFAKSVVEGVMSGRPTIASRVCTDLDYFGEAVLPVEPNNIEAYIDVITKLYDDGDFYQQVQQQCGQYRDAFSDPNRGWGGILRRLFSQRFGTVVTPIPSQEAPVESK